jgi:hypothetical protein
VLGESFSAVSLEFDKLQRLVDTHCDLLQEVTEVAPGPRDISALAIMLHSFYTGIERVFGRVARELEGGVAAGGDWHKSLLRSMAEPRAGHVPVITQTTATRLEAYLAFRHFVRSAYTFEYKWSRMAELVRDCQEVLDVVRSEVRGFLADLQMPPSPFEPEAHPDGTGSDR